MSTLRTAIQTLAEDFANNLISRMASASLEEITGAGVGGAAATSAPKAAKIRKASSGEGNATAGRRVRRSAEDIEAVIAKIQAALKTAGEEGLRSEALQAELGIEKADIVKPIVEALKTGIIKKQGQKRATTYFLGSAKATKAKTKTKTAPAASSKIAKKKASKRSAKKKVSKKKASALTA